MPHRLGRRPRVYNPAVPHLSALLGPRKDLAPPPPSADWLSPLPDDLGMMLNDQLGDCTVAAIGHCLQVWTMNATGQMLTEPDPLVLRWYEVICGYNPTDPNTDRGGIEQHVLRCWARRGVPLVDTTHNQLAAFIEIDPRNHDDVKRAIADCGLVYIGFNVPAFLMAEAPPPMWDVQPAADNSIVGGHAVILPAYAADDGPLGVISWGAKYSMSWAFWDAFVDEAYALADPDWINARGTTPGGLTLADLEAQMRALV